MVPTRNIIVLLVAIIFIVISAQNSTADGKFNLYLI